jgi:tetratricopeptide (TPR) repeat protein
MDGHAARELLALALAVEAHAADDDVDVWTGKLESRVGDIAAAADAFLDEGMPTDALDLVGALGVFWQDIGQVAEGRALTADVVRRTTGSGEVRARARAFLVLGQLAFRQGDQCAASEATATAAALAQQCGDGYVEARAELNLARVAFREGNTPRIFEHARRVEAAAGDDVRLRTGAIHMLGWAEYTAGNLDGAIAHFEHNVALYREAGNTLDCASELANLGDLAAEQGDLDRAAEYLRSALATTGIADNRYLGPSLVRSAATVAGLRGNAAAALSLFAAADQLYEQFGIVADPGDDVSPEVLAQVEGSLDIEAVASALAAGAGWSLPAAVANAQEALA